MPSARIHEAVAEKVNKNYNMDDTLLRIGTIAPDSWRNVSEENKNKYQTHFWDFRIKKGQANDYKEFYLKYYDDLNNPFCFGYLLHLITDQYWKTYVDPLYEKKENGMKYFKLKNGEWHDDSNWFGYVEDTKAQKMVAKKYNLGILPTESENIEGFKCTIDELNLDGLFGKNGSLYYVNKDLSPKNDDEESLVYGINDLSRHIDETAEFINKELIKLENFKKETDSKLKIAIDIDDTLLETKELEEYYWKIFLNEHKEINPNKTYEWEDEELAKFWSEYREKMPFGKVKDGAADVIKKFLDNGYIVNLLTARPLDKYRLIKPKLVEYFEKNNINYNYLIMGYHSKGEYLKKHNYDILIDDDIKNIKEANDNGITGILFGHDKDFDGYEASNFEDVYKIVQNKFNTSKKSR